MNETHLNEWKELLIKAQDDRQRLYDLMIEHFNEPCSVALKKFSEEKRRKNNAINFK